MKSKREIAVLSTAMTKGLAALLMALALVFTFASCDTNSSDDNETETVYRTVTYSTEHATAPEKLTVADGTALTAEQLPALTESGYTFGGWYDGETKAETGYKVTKNVTLTAKWTVNSVTPTPDDGEDDGGDTGKTTTYTVTFSTNGGTTVASQKIESGKNATEPIAPTKNGYTFGGWFTDSNFTTAFTFSTAITADITLYAKWIDATKPTFTLTFSVDGTETKQIVAEGEKASKPTAPAKTGYNFDDWYNGDTKFDFDTPITANLTLTAKWTLISYTITYEGLNGAENPNTAESYTIESETITLQNPAKSGYTFNGWFDAETGGNKVERIAQGSTGAKTLYATWTPNTLSPITITLGKVEADQELTVSLSDRTFTATSGFTLYEWHIDGVKVDGAEGSTYTADQSALSYGNHSLMVIAKDSNGSRFGAEATFTVNKNVCKVTFDTKGGSTVADKVIYADEHIEKPADPTKKGYTFEGWFNGESEFDFDSAVTENITLTAKWATITYTITYEDLDGAENPNTITSYTVESETITLQNPSKEGYTFTGWYDAETGGNKIESIVQGSTGAKTFYAQWTLITYTITYEGLNGAANPNTATSYTVESETITLQNPARAYYTFDGWFDAETGGNKVESIAKGSTEAKTLYAQWTAISYEITYVLPNGVTNPNVTSYTIETDTITLQAISREGYAFTGWYDAETGGNKIESIAQGSTGAKTLYAQWWTFSLQVTGTPSKTLYYVGDSLDSTGLTVTATYSDGSSKTVSGVSSKSVSLGSKLTISYTENGLTKTADVSGTFYVAAAEAKPTESPVKLSDSDYTGTLADGTYYAFGDFPQTIAAGTVTFSDEPVYNGYYLGSDGYFYAKCTENAYSNSYTYSDGTTVARSGANRTKYFKVEPIKWRVLNPSAEGNKILEAESILTANVAYYDYYNVYRTIGEKTVYPNNYEHSKIRAYLNGLSYEVKETDSAEQTTDSTYNGIGFLQTAFTATAQSLIATTTVDNSAASTNTASNASQWNSGTNKYACDNTSDKIFLLSEKEATTSDYGFTEYNVYGNGNSRIRVTTDYAKANYAYQSSTAGGWWWLRSPIYDYSNYARFIKYDGMANYNDYVDIMYGGVVPALCLSSLE